MCLQWWKSAKGCHEGKNVCKQGGEGLVINRGGMGPSLWEQDIGHVTLAQSFPKLSFSAPPWHFCPIYELSILKFTFKKMCLT